MTDASQVVVEEGPDTTTVQKEVVGVADSFEPCHAALRVSRQAVVESWVTGLQVVGPWLWCHVIARSLPIWCLTLLHGRKYVCCIIEVVLIESVVLHGCADQPRSFCCFDQRTASDGDGLLIAAIEIMVRGPAPHVLDVRRRRAR